MIILPALLSIAFATIALAAETGEKSKIDNTIIEAQNYLRSMHRIFLEKLKVEASYTVYNLIEKTVKVINEFNPVNDYSLVDLVPSKSIPFDGNDETVVFSVSLMKTEENYALNSLRFSVFYYITQNFPDSDSYSTPLLMCRILDSNRSLVKLVPFTFNEIIKKDISIVQNMIQKVSDSKLWKLGRQRSLNTKTGISKSNDFIRMGHEFSEYSKDSKDGFISSVKEGLKNKTRSIITVHQIQQKKFEDMMKKALELINDPKNTKFKLLFDFPLKIDDDSPVFEVRDNQDENCCFLGFFFLNKTLYCAAFDVNGRPWGGCAFLSEGETIPMRKYLPSACKDFDSYAYSLMNMTEHLNKRFQNFGDKMNMALFCNSLGFSYADMDVTIGTLYLEEAHYFIFCDHKDSVSVQMFNDGLLLDRSNEETRKEFHRYYSI